MIEKDDDTPKDEPPSRGDVGMGDILATNSVKHSTSSAWREMCLHPP